MKYSMLYAIRCFMRHCPNKVLQGTGMYMAHFTSTYNRRAHAYYNL